ncbi:MAG: Rpn family recombination-promoting nuclease/putative transposase [Saprospiraceae bacterium]
MSKENQKKQVHQPDDRLIKTVMKEKENAQAYLKNFHPELVEILDIDQLEPQPESFLTPEFDLFESDIIYRCPFKNSEKSLYLSLIWENKLNPTKWISIQLGLYIFLALDRMVKEKGRKVEPILPLLFYNGQQKWQPKTVNDLFKDHPYYEQFKQFLPSFSFLFKNIVEVPTSQLLKIEAAFLRSALVAMASRHDFDLIIQNINVIFDEQLDYQFKSIFTYIYGVTEPSKENMTAIVEQIKSKDSKAKAKNALEMLLMEGEEIGIKKGEKIGIRKERLFQVLRMISAYPKESSKKIAYLTEEKLIKVTALKKALTTKKKKEIQKVLNSQFLNGINLTRSEKIKITKLINSIMKKEVKK